EDVVWGGGGGHVLVELGPGEMGAGVGWCRQFVGSAAVAWDELHRGRRPGPEDHDQPDGQQYEPYPALTAPGARPRGPRTTATSAHGVGRFPAGPAVLDLPPRPARAGPVLLQPELTRRRRRARRTSLSAAPSPRPPRLPH